MFFLEFKRVVRQAEDMSALSPTALLPRFGFGGHEFEVVGKTALYWPAQAALIVADLHLEKASWFATRGQMLPPYDSLATLQRLSALVTLTGAQQIWCLGDNFHDDDATNRLEPAAHALLAALTAALDWRWIVGNHDSGLGGDIGGSIIDEAEVAGLILRHRACPNEMRPELSGHFHPKFHGQSRGRRLSRPCFVMSQTRLILPAFGAFTGGLAADHPEIIAAVGPGAEALVPTAKRLLRFAL